MSKEIAVQFWGVRGSISSSNYANPAFGNSTPCVAIRYGKWWFVCDAGTGIYPLGKKLEKGKNPIALFISHLHWDHIFGLPFFLPFYQKKRKIIFYGPHQGKGSFKKAIGEIMKPPYFPIRPSFWGKHVEWKSLKESVFKVGSVKVSAQIIRHHKGTLGYQFEFPNGKRLIYVADHELLPSDKKFAKWIEGCDLLIHDTHYDKKEYAKRKGWGHSAYETVLKIAMQQKVKKLILFHHNPSVSDATLRKRLAWCKKEAKRKKSSIKCTLAKEGSKVLL